MRKLRSYGVNSDMLVTFYNAVMCSIIMFGSVCWGGNISKLEETVQKTNANIKRPYTPNETIL